MNTAKNEEPEFTFPISRELLGVNAGALRACCDASDDCLAFVFVEWPDRIGYYEQLTGGRWECTVFNESEIFTDEEACQRWLFERVEVIR